MKKIYRMEILKSVDGWDYEVYLNSNRANEFTEGRILAILGEDIEKVIGGLPEPIKPVNEYVVSNVDSKEDTKP